MEGHLEVPNEENVTVPQIEKPWKSLYFRIKEGRFQWFAVGFFTNNSTNFLSFLDTRR